MEGLLKSRPVFISLVLSVFFFILSIGSCINLNSQSSLRKKEMAKRLDAEEKLVKLSQENKTLSEKLSVKEKELEEERVAFQATKKALLQEQMVCQTLKDELQKLTKVKEALEEDLKKALQEIKKVKK